MYNELEADGGVLHCTYDAAHHADIGFHFFLGILVTLESYVPVSANGARAVESDQC